MNRYIQLSREISRSRAGMNYRPLPNLQPAERFIEGVTPSAFTRAMKFAATGVNIVTTDGPAGRFGMTVSAFSSLSAEPPQVLACINRRSPVGEAIVENGSLCVNLLSAGQRQLADIFAGIGQEGRPYDFGAAQWESQVSGAPVLEGAVAAFDCVLGSSIAAGTHRIFIGRVVAVTAQGGQTLLYTNRAYGQPSQLD
jgi:flavin reductase